MDHVAAASCPRCRTPLHSVHFHEDSLKHCEQCGGLWLEQTTLRRLQNLDGAQRESASKELLAIVAEIPSLGVRPSFMREIQCPDCQASLKSHHLSYLAATVCVDVCDAHGVWYDAHEIATALPAQGRRRPSTDNNRGVALTPGTSLAQEAAVAGGEFAVSALIDWIFDI